jgi:hypothetical protein
MLFNCKYQSLFHRKCLKYDANKLAFLNNEIFSDLL